MSNSLFTSVTELLMSVTPRAEHYATLITERYGSAAALLEASADSIANTLQGDTRVALFIRLCCVLSVRRITDGFKIGAKHTEDEICEYFRALLAVASVETVYLMSLDPSSRVIACDFVGEGTVNYSSVFPRKLLELALKRGASGVVIAHNHPGGIASASPEDGFAMNMLFELFASSGINVLMGCIVANGECKTVYPHGGSFTL